MNTSDLFKKYVKVLEIENTSFCNRKCSFCGNSIIDRSTFRYTMPEELYVKFIEDLANINYNGVLNFNRYNEPFADKIILDRIKIARTKLKDARLMSFSNSDYLDEKYICEIRDVGLDVLNIQVYSEKKLSQAEAVQAIENMRVKLGNYPSEIIISEGMIECVLKDTGMQRVCIQYKNFDCVGNSRGGIIKHLEKQECSGACYNPVISLVIDYNGNVMPCCNLRSDCKEHEPYILGNINNESIIDIYSNKAATSFRKKLLTNNRPDVCKYCNDNKVSLVREET